MMGTKIRLQGGAIPYREALVSALVTNGFEADYADPTNGSDADHSVEPGDADAMVIFADAESRWENITALAPQLPTVAVLPELNIEQYVRALSCGAGAVYYDSSSTTMVDVIVAALRGESLLPTAVTMALAKHEPPTTADMMVEPLTPLEEEIAAHLLEGETVNAIAERLNYGDRTMRRRIKGLYLKLGASNRSDALTILRQRREGHCQ